jgi:hypothetical protein
MKTHQRRWNNRHVDFNLDDSWLERLNALNLFNLISICEGHSCDKHPYDKQPHINLRLTSQHLSKIHIRWLTCREAIHALVATSPVCNDIYIHASFSHEYSFPDASIRHEEFGIQVLCRRLRNQPTLEPWFDLWFQQAITLIETFDMQLTYILIDC